MTRSRSALLDPLFASSSVQEIFSDRATIQAMLDAEAALIRAEAACGVVPESAVGQIESACDASLYDIAALGAATAKAGNPVIPLVKALIEQSGDAGGYVHWGATSQDISDTGLVLQMRNAFNKIDAHLESLCEALAGLAARHRGDPMAGRTFMQQALPVTFGLRAANWLSPLLRHRERLDQALPRILTLQFSGAVGTLASLGGDGDRVTAALARELDLPATETAWHTARDRVGEAASLLALIAGSLNKIATDIALLAQTEIGEVAEPGGKGRGGSSTMPQKRNPVGAASVKASTGHVQALASAVLTLPGHDHERATGGWHGEWLALPDIFIYAAGALERLSGICTGLEVDTERMRANLDSTGGQIMAEAVMMALAPQIGRDEAHHAVADACKQATAENRHLKDVIAAMPSAANIGKTQLDRIFDPATYTGSASARIDRVLDHHKRLKAK